MQFFDGGIGGDFFSGVLCRGSGGGGGGGGDVDASIGGGVSIDALATAPASNRARISLKLIGASAVVVVNSSTPTLSARRASFLF